MLGEPSITPAMSFIGSQREAWMTIGAFGEAGGPLWTTSTCRLIRPGEPSRRRNGTTGGAPSPSMSPV